VNQDLDAELGALFVAYRNACPDPDAGAAFMPGMWAKIEARQQSSTLFGRLAKTLVTVALAASVLLGTLAFTFGTSNSHEPGTYLEALAAEHVAGLDSLSLERIADMEQQ
jgi:hypothetical protein